MTDRQTDGGREWPAYISRFIDQGAPSKRQYARDTKYLKSFS